MRRARDSCAAATRNMGHTDRLCHAMCGSFVAVTLGLSKHDPAQMEAAGNRDSDRPALADGQNIMSFGRVPSGMIVDAYDSIISITAFDSAAAGSPRRSTASK